MRLEFVQVESVRRAPIDTRDAFGIAQDDLGDLKGGCRSEDGSSKARSEEQREPADVIEVPVREDYRIERRCANRRGFGVFRSGVGIALEETAVDEHRGLSHCDVGSGAGDPAGCAVQGEGGGHCDLFRLSAGVSLLREFHDRAAPCGLA
jgi:hypothetical protein